MPFLRFFFIGLVLCFLGVVYYRVGLFPGRLLDKALAKIESVTHKKVLCDKILFLPFRGFTLGHLKVFEKNGAPIFSADSLSINVRILPFFREKKIIINHLVMNSPVYDFSFAPANDPEETPPKTVISGQIDVPVVPEASSVQWENVVNGPDFFLPENVYIEQIEIKNGLFFIRKNKLQPVVEVIHDVNLRVGFQKPPLLLFEGQMKLGESSYASVDLKGQWDLEKDRYDFYLSTLSREVPPWLLDYQKGHFLILKQGQFSLKTHLVRGEGSVVLFQSKAHLKNALIQVSQAQYSGQMHLEAQGIFDTAWKKFKNYRGHLELVRVNVSHLSSTIKQLDNLTGILDFQPDLLTIRSVRGDYKKIAFEATGSVNSFRDLILNGQIRSRLTVDELLALLPPETVKKINGLKIDGRCEAITLLRGSLKPPSKIETEHKLSIQNASVQNVSKRINWSNLSGEIRLSAKGIEVSQARFMLSDLPATLNAFIPKEEAAPGWFHLQSKSFEIKSDYTVHGDDLWLARAKASLPGATAAFKGKLIQWTDPSLQFEGETEISLERLSSEGSAKHAILKSLRPEGTLRGPFVLNGHWNAPLDWDFKMDAQSPLLRIQKTLPLEQFQIQLRMKNRVINVPYLHASFEGGTLGCRISFDLTKPGPLFDGRLYLINVDLAKLGPDLKKPKKNLAGTLVGQLSLQGNLQNAKSYRGQGAMSITKGFLWQTSQFKAMGNLPLVKVEGLDLVTFHEMNATFKIHDKKIHTENLSILGDAVNLSLRGTLSFDSKLDMLMNIQYSDAVYRGADATGGFVPMVVQQAGDLISQYHVHGNLNEPKYDKMLIPVANAVGKKIGGILQTIAS
jgi:hypothetical protein